MASFVTGVHPNAAAVGDFDGDGDCDVVVPGLLTPQLATLWNDGGELSYRLEDFEWRGDGDQPYYYMSAVLLGYADPS